MTTRTTLALLLIALAGATPGRAAAEQFVLYRTRPASGRPPFEGVGPVQLADDVASHRYLITGARQLGVPAVGGPVTAPSTTGLVEYAVTAIHDAPPIGKRSRVPAADQCGDVTVTLKQPTSLLVPATVDPHGTAAPPDPDTTDLDHFLCYKAAVETRLPDGTHRPRFVRGRQMDVADAFGSRRYDLLAITKVCRPVDKDVDPANPPVVLSGPDAGRPKPIAPAAIQDPERTLVCYRAKVATTYVAQSACGPADSHDHGRPFAQATVAPTTGVSTADQLGALWHDATRPTEICIASGPRDTDHDGVADADDACPSTAPGATQVIAGCSALDLVQHPENLLVPLRKNAEAVIDQIDGDADLADAVQDIVDALPEYDEAARVTRAGDPCQGRERAGVGDAHFASMLRKVGVLQAIAESDAEMSRPDVGDLTPEGSRRMLLDGILVWAQGLVTDGRRVTDALGAVCDLAAPVHTRGVVRTVDDGDRRIELADGRIFGVADPLRMDAPLGPGQTVEITGLQLSPQEGMGTEVSPGDGYQIPKAAYLDCLRLRVAPIQRFGGYAKGPLTLHQPEGYEVNGTLLLEQSMRFAVADVCKPSPYPTVSFARYSVEIDATGNGQSTTLSMSLAPGDAPVTLPYNYGAGTITVRHLAQTCRFVGLQLQCDQPVETYTETYPYVTVNNGSLCTVAYSNTLLDVNDQVPNDFRTIWVENVKTVDMNDPGTSPVFEAEGYPVDQGLSSYPVVQPVVGSQPFAIHNTDFMKVLWQPVSGFNDLTPLFAQFAAGVDHAAGLAWPHVRGTNNGHVWQYSCPLEKIVRDVVDFCPGPTQALYRLPFAPDDLSWKQGQPNLPTCPDNKNAPQGVCAKSADDYCTHGGGYAYDMIAPCMAKVRAARAGRVVIVNTMSNQNSKSSCPVTNSPCGTTTTCNPKAPDNNIWIQHQDGSVVRYVHANQNQIFKKLGDYVKRGELIATVGMTGNTDGPHMHFGGYPKVGASSWLTLFEGVDPDTKKVLTCYEPKPDDFDGTCYGFDPKPLRSNNKKQ